MELQRTGWILVLSGLLTSCTTTRLTTTKVDLASPARGQVYYLPRVEYSVTAERELTACEAAPTHDFLVLKWLESEVANLALISESFEDLATLRKHPQCAAQREDIRRKVGFWPPDFDTLNRVPEPCSAGEVALKRSYDDARFAMLDRLLRDAGARASRHFSEATSAGSVARIDGSADPGLAIAQLVTVVRELLQRNPDGPTVPAVVEITIEHRVQVLPLSLADESQVYAIDYTEIRGSLKKTDFEVEKYPNGTLKSLNVMIEDQTGNFVAATVKSLAGVASIVGGFPMLSMKPAGAAPQGQSIREPESFQQFLDRHSREYIVADLCKPKIRQLLAERKALSGEGEAVAEEILNLGKEIVRAESELVQQKEKLAVEKKKRDATKEGTPERKDADAAVVEQDGLVEAAQAVVDRTTTRRRDRLESTRSIADAYAKVRAKLTLVDTTHFRPEAGVSQVELEGVDRAVDSWFSSTEALVTFCREHAEQCLDGRTPKPLHSWVAIYSSCPKDDCKATSKLGNGLVYREPLRALLLVCRESKCLDGKNIVAPAKDRLLVAATEVPQLGVLASLPLENKAFQNNRLEASFSELGSVLKVKYASNARAVEAAKAAQATTDEILKIVEAKRGEKKASLEAKKAEVEAETELLKKRLELEKARKQLDEFDDSADGEEP